MIVFLRIVLTFSLIVTYALASSGGHGHKQPFSYEKLIPDISMIFDGSYVYRDIEDSEMAKLHTPGLGFTITQPRTNQDRITYNTNKGLNFNYVELDLKSRADETFTLDGVFQINEHTVVAEEVYFTNLGMPYGITMQLGKFLSHLGRLHRQHHHYWDFNDMPFIYEAFLGLHGLNELGLQVQWHAPRYENLRLGFELFQGRNEAIFGYAQIHHDHNHTTAEPTEDHPDAAAILVGFAKAAFSLGHTTIEPGISYVYGSSRTDETHEEPSYSLDGVSVLYGIDLLVTQHLGDSSGLFWQTEWMKRRLRADKTLVSGGGHHAPALFAATEPADDHATDDHGTDEHSPEFTGTLYEQEGFYTQLVFAPDDHWRFGARYENLYRNDVKELGHDLNLASNFERYSAMGEYRFGDHTRVRLQYNRNLALFNEAGDRRPVDSFMIAFNIGFGPHARYDNALSPPYLPESAVEHHEDTGHHDEKKVHDGKKTSHKKPDGKHGSKTAH